MTADNELVRERLLQTFELWEDGVQIMRENLQRRLPHATDEQIEGELDRWLVGPDVTASDGTVVARPSHPAVTSLARTLRTVVDLFPAHQPLALVGGLAVSVRTEPCFTRNLDFAIAVDDDAEPERILFELHGRGFTVAATIEHATTHRLTTARLRQSAEAPFVDLLFAACGIEREIVGAASQLKVLGTTVPVATVGHLVAMKLVSRDPRRRPRDQQDLVDLAKVADAAQWDRAAAAIELIHERGFSRGRDLRAGLAEIRSLADE